MYNFMWQRLAVYSAKYQLQQPAVQEFNSTIDEVQRELISMLAPYANMNEKVRALLEPWIRRIYDTSDQNGQIDFPQRVGVEEEVTETFFRVISMSVTGAGGTATLFPIHPIMESEITIAQLMPQRAPDLTKNRAYYNVYDGVIQLYPMQGIPYLMWYLVYPVAAILAFNYEMQNGEYVQVYDPDNTVDLYWNENASNILLYMLLQKYGISVRDDLIAEFGRIGITTAIAEPAK